MEFDFKFAPSMVLAPWCLTLLSFSYVSLVSIACSTHPCLVPSASTDIVDPNTGNDTIVLGLFEFWASTITPPGAGTIFVELFELNFELLE
jgi:hypothetical protein